MHLQKKRGAWTPVGVHDTPPGLMKTISLQRPEGRPQDNADTLWHRGCSCEQQRRGFIPEPHGSQHHQGLGPFPEVLAEISGKAPSLGEPARRGGGIPHGAG